MEVRVRKDSNHLTRNPIGLSPLPGRTGDLRTLFAQPFDERSARMSWSARRPRYCAMTPLGDLMSAQLG